MTWRVNFRHSNDAQKQLQRTSLRLFFAFLPLQIGSQNLLYSSWFRYENNFYEKKNVAKLIANQQQLMNPTTSTTYSSLSTGFLSFLSIRWCAIFKIAILFLKRVLLFISTWKSEISEVKAESKLKVLCQFEHQTFQSQGRKILFQSLALTWLYFLNLFLNFFWSTK